jgi:predicted PurR-regulated permease PerM
MKRFFDNEHSVVISPSSIIFGVFFIIGLFFLYFIRDIVMTLFLALILMSALNPAVKKLEKKLKIPRIVGIFVLYIAIIFLLVLAFILIVPPLISEIPNLVSTLALPPLPSNLSTLHFSVSEISGLLNQVKDSFSAIYNVVTSTFSGIFSFFTVLVMASYLLLDRDNLHKKIGWFSRQKKHFELAKELIDTVEVHLGGWVRGQVFLMLTIGILSYVGLTLFRIPYALPLSLLAGLLEILPNLGPVVSAIPGIVITFGAYGPAMAGFIALFYMIIQQLENNFIVPKIMKQSVDVNPLTTILVILIGFKVAGIPGAFLAVPAYIVIRSAYSIWLREYGDRA